MKKLTFTLLLLLLFNILMAQDYILKRNGDEIYGNVFEVTSTEIKYTDSLTAHITRILNVSDVFMIRYRNGVKELFQLAPAIQEIPTTKRTLENEPILKLGGYDYRVDGIVNEYKGTFSYLKSQNNEEVTALLKKARISGTTGNLLGFSSIPVFMCALALIDYSHPASMLSLMTGVGLNVGNIVLKVKRKKHFDNAVDKYNSTIE
jgi:hypothetical protein